MRRKKRLTLFKRFLHAFQYGCLRAFIIILGYLDHEGVLALARCAGFLFFTCFRLRRTVTLNNLRQAFGDRISEEELNRIARAAYNNIGATFFEMLLPKSKEEVLEMVDLGELNVLKRRLAEGRGVIIVSAHLGNWEYMGAALAAAGIPLTAVAARQANKLVERYVDRCRTAAGMKVIKLGESVKQIVQALRNQEAVGLISDQNGGKRGIFVPFFGRLASTVPGPAQLALRYRAPLVIVATLRTAPGCYHTIFKEVAVRPDDTVFSLTQRFTGVLEELIVCYPEQYFWMHRRWKTRPEDLVRISKVG